MFRELIPLLAGDYHVIAPDHLGFGRSAAPSAAEFTYTFDALAELTSGLLDQLGLDRYALYVQDYGAPIGWRLALKHPGQISALITQNGNGYEDGFVEPFWTDVWAYGANPGPGTEPAARAALSLDAIHWQYVHGVPDPSLVSPDTWEHDFALVSREGNDEIQLALFRDYQNNRPLYPLLHEFLRTSEVPRARRVGPQRRDLRPRGSTGLCPRCKGCGGASDQRRSLPAGEPPGRRRRIPPRLPRTSVALSLWR